VRKLIPALALFAVAACSAEQGVAAAPQPQKTALLRCDQQVEKCDKPLLFVDGKRTDWVGSPDLVPGDIESIEVIKGKTALDRYGADARNGVVFITMKKSSRL